MHLHNNHGNLYFKHNLMPWLFRIERWHGGKVCSKINSQLQGPWVNSKLGFLSVKSFAYSSYVPVGILQVFLFPRTSQKHLKV